jgi:DNA-binding Xre family transcriptional regulator
MGVLDMSARGVIQSIIKDKKISNMELAEKLHITKQNLSNKMIRDNFSTIELVEIADALNMQLVLKDNADGKEYVIDYPAEEKGKPKRRGKTTKTE